ncbi:ATP-dependent nuclease [Enterovibrio norvegicus]|uniref:ATP-dependent nuclease n=1 Tax=Enterovibrio norvegicus TaxID=188144 RepID=UPI0024B12365|nr:AAA family ATPase [Enterovibrio norvegicus]
MRLKSIYISEYKNLKDFTLEFSQDFFLEVFVGKNGSGKSNFIEALLEVLRHIYQYDWGENRHELLFSYRLTYELEGQEYTVEFDFVTGQLKINDVERATIGATPKPDNILTYYAGHNTAINDLLSGFDNRFAKRIIRADHNESRPFIGITRSYNDLLLTVFALLPDTSSAKQYVFDKLGIQEITTDFRVNLKRPFYAQKTTRANYDVQVGDETTKYWKLAGTALTSLQDLEDCFSGPDPDGRIRTEGYLNASDTYQLYFSLDRVRAKFPEYSAHDHFRVFDNLKSLGMLESITLTLKVSGEQEITSNMFSDGQFQAIYLFAISEIFKDSNSITIMDEPDSFLHPEWQADCSKQIQAISSEALASNHVLMSTHSAVTLINSPQERIRYFEHVGGRVRTYTLPRRESVRRLCQGVITYTEEEQMLSVLNAIHIERKPVLFTEGSTDPLIIKSAWYKLYPELEMPFIPFYAFSCSYINQLITDQRIHGEMEGRKIFALFDFDEAYNQWHSLNGQIIRTDAAAGLVKKWDGGESYAIMLPIPNHPDIQKQVFTDDSLTLHFEGRSYCMVEHIFYGKDGTDGYFVIDNVPGGQLIKFQGCKTTFAKEVVPRLPEDSFETFRPMLDWIAAKCAA